MQKYHYANFKTGEYDFTSRGFALDPKAVNQCYVTSEPYVWAQQGIKVKYALIASTGYDPYGDVIFTTRDMIAKHPDRVIEKAVYGMLPKTALGRQVLRLKLRVYADADHPHAAQQPTVLKLRQSESK